MPIIQALGLGVGVGGTGGDVIIGETIEVLYQDHPVLIVADGNPAIRIVEDEGPLVIADVPETVLIIDDDPTEIET